MSHTTLLFVWLRCLPPRDQERCHAWLWSHLRAAFPMALGALCSPGRIGLLVPGSDPEPARRELGYVLGWARRTFPALKGPGAAPRRPLVLTSPAAVLDRVELFARLPAQLDLVADPLEWPWSTHRDLLGAAIDPWVRPARLASALGLAHEGCAEQHRARVAEALPRVPPALPAPARPGEPYPIEVIEAAVRSATRGPVHAIRRAGLARQLFATLAPQHGHPTRLEIAARCGTTTRTVSNLWRRRPAQEDLEVARLCLADPRLRSMS